MDKGEGGGFSHCGHFADMGGGGVNFLQFCADVFYEQPLTSFLLNGNELTEANFDNHFDAFTFLTQRVINKHSPLKQLSRKQKN